jgi:hypothetical protein
MSSRSATSMSTLGAASFAALLIDRGSTGSTSALFCGNGIAMRPDPFDRLPGRGGRGGPGVRASAGSARLSSDAPSVSSRLGSVAIGLEF